MMVLLATVGFLVISLEVLLYFLKAIVKFVYGLRNNYEKNEILKLSDELLKLKEEQKDLDIQNQFAKYSRIQRKINEFTDKLSVKKKRKNFDIIKLVWKFKIACYVSYTCSMLIIVYCNRYSPVVVLPETWFPYGNKVVSFPTNVNGGIGIPFWIMICRQVSRVILY